MVRRLHDELRVLRWAVTASSAARRQLRTGRVQEVVLVDPPGVMAGAGVALRPFLRVAVARNCLVRALVRQAWHRARGVDRDVVIGVSAPRRGFRAHAWLDGDPGAAANGFTELARYESR